MDLQSFVEKELELLILQERNYMKNLTLDQLDKRLIQGKTPQEFINDNIRSIMTPLYDIQDYSEANLEYLLQTVYSLSHFQNIVPLTLNDDEFVEISKEYDKIVYQNKRNKKVFKEIVYTHLDGKDSLDKVSGKSFEKYEQLQLDL